MTGNLNLNEVGQVIRVNVGKNITASTPTLIIQPEFGQGKEITTGVIIPDEDHITDLETFWAGEYIEYKTIDGDLDYVGRWRKRAKLNFSSTDIELTDFIKFRVLS